ncbi:MAG: hypothetical protein O7A98_10095 [Acidobacteria bacterium]|nr:hypothetical protein [Acidobacteriota bacterium]
MARNLLWLTAALICSLSTGTATWAQNGWAEGSFTVDGEMITIEHITVHEQEDPFEEGQTAYLLTLSEQKIPYVEVDDMCPGEYGNRAIQLKVDQNREIFMTNYCFQGGNSSGETFVVTFESFGPQEYSGSVAAELEVFDSKVAFDLRFSALLPEELPGELLPAGGGEPGAAYLAWTAAVKSGDLERIKALLSPDQLEGFDALPAEEQEENVEFLQMMAPNEVEVLGGRLVDDIAYLEIRATMEGEPASGEVKLEHGGGIWVVVSESWSN